MKEPPEIIDAEFKVIGEPEPPCYEPGSWPPRDVHWSYYVPFFVFIFSIAMALIRHAGN